MKQETIYIVKRGNWSKTYTTPKEAKKALDSNPDNELFEYALKSKIESINNKVTKEVSAATKERKLVNDRLFRYYFVADTEVILDDENITIKDSDYDFNPLKLEQYIGKKGIVTRCKSDMHAFAHGSSYVLDVDFSGEKLESIPAYYFVEYK